MPITRESNTHPYMNTANSRLGRQPQQAAEVSAAPATTPGPGQRLPVTTTPLAHTAAASHGQTHIYNLYRFKHFLKYINFLIYAI